MTKVKDILSINLEDDIKSVVDIDISDESEEDKIDELNDFILTETLAKHLMDFCDYYSSETRQPGIWLSGFYGSGKSFFAKILGYLLENPTWKGTTVVDRFAPKLEGLKDASLLHNDINEIAKMSNLIVRFDVSKHNNEHGVSFMLLENFLHTLGCLSNSMGLWEYDMKNEGTYDEFCRRVEQIEGKSWADIKRTRSQSRKTFRKVMLDWQYDEYDFEQTMKDYNDHIKTYDATKLADDLSKYLDHHKDVRIVFFLDEVSEAINQGRIKIDELQGLAEALWRFDKHVWTICIAQQQLDDVVNAAMINRNSITKMTDRFHKGININAEEIDTIIRQRLLAKNDEGNNELSEYYKVKNGVISDITNIGGGLPITKNVKTFSAYYPFFEHQFRLLQYFLFGSGNLVSTQGGTRGMLLSSFDVLRKESMKDASLFTTVNAIQLCRQAEENVDSSLENRYNQAEGIINADDTITRVNGRELLMVIHFLTKASVVKTTIENITKASVRNMDEYYELLSGIRKSLDILVDNRVLIFSEGQYRITSEAEQRILDKKHRLEEDIPSFQINSFINKHLQLMPFVRKMQSTQVGGMKISFLVGIRNGEVFANSSEDAMKFLLSGLFDVAPTDGEYVETIKTDTQSEKGEANLIPTTQYNDPIFSLVRDLISMDYLTGDSTYTSDEKKAVQVILNTREEKTHQLEELISKAYTEGNIVYCYDSLNVSEDKIDSIVGDIQGRMYNNIFTRRLSGTLTDKLATRVFHTNANLLYKIYGDNPDFQFFDNSGKFIGDNLSVVTEITALSKQYITGVDLEKKLQAPPTGFDYGTIISTVAALFRGDKVIAKFGGNEYHSWKDDGAEEIFSTSKNFGKASFKSVVVTLSYKERIDIVDILKEDCHYKEITGYDINYQYNDFALVQAIANVARTERQKVLKNIFGDNELERLFNSSVSAMNFLKDYDGTVTNANYLQTAHQFLDEHNNEEYVKAVEHIERDIRFIDNNFDEIHDEENYLKEVDEELKKADFGQTEFTTLKDKWKQMHDTNVVTNFKSMKEVIVKVSDFYHEVMKQEAAQLAEKYVEVGNRLEAFTAKLSAYDRSWNESLWKQAESLQNDCEKYARISIDIPKMSISDRKTGYALHDFVNQITLADNWFTKIDVWETQIRTSTPTPRPTPGSGSGSGTTPEPQPKPEPKVVNMKSKMPRGKKHVSDYKSWLMQQLAIVNQMKSDDIVDFDN